MATGQVVLVPTPGFPPGMGKPYGEHMGEYSMFAVGTDLYRGHSVTYVSDDEFFTKMGVGKSGFNTVNLVQGQTHQTGQGFLLKSLLEGGISALEYTVLSYNLLDITHQEPILEVGGSEISIDGAIIFLGAEGLYVNGQYVSPNDRFKIGPDGNLEVLGWFDPKSGEFSPYRCFPAHTRIQTSRTASTSISALRVGDVVLAFDARSDKGRGALVPRRVTRLYRNTTTEWIRLRWFDGTAWEVITTPGHHFLDEFGEFPTIEDMTRTGSATVVLASGALTQVTAERITFCAETAHLFARAVTHVAAAGNAALQPVELDSWATYNFEVEDLHTYVAEGIRVHNDSGWFGALGTAVFASGVNGSGRDADGQIDRASHTGFLDSVGDGIANTMHAMGTIVNGVIGGFVDGLQTAGKALNTVLGPLFGPGGNKKDPDDYEREVWKDTNGQTHFGSKNEFQRAEEAGTVAKGESGTSKSQIEQDSYRDKQSPLSPTTSP